ncbi:polar amino acid transport system substrate-binding protein [Oxalobacteraceae bacterium GrIS 1.11]
MGHNDCTTSLSTHATAMTILARLVFAAHLAMAPALAWANENITLTSGEWLPYLSPQSRQYGVISHIVSTAFAREGITVHYVFLPWSRAYVEADKDGSNGSIIWSKDAERARDFYFSDTVFEGQTVFFHLKSLAFDWTDFDSLSNLKVGGTLGYKYEFEKNPKIHLDHAVSDEVNFRKLLAGRFQIFAADLNVGNTILKERFSAQERERVTHHPRPYNLTRYYLILARNNQHNAYFLERFNRGLKRMRDDGTYAKYIDAFERGEYAKP